MLKKWNILLITGVIFLGAGLSIVFWRTTLSKPRMLPKPRATHTVLPPVAVTAKRGDSLASIFLQMGLSYNELTKITALPLTKKYLQPLPIHQQLLFHVNHQDRLMGLTAPINLDKNLIIALINGVYSAKIEHKPLVKTWRYRQGKVHHSLAQAMRAAKIPSTIINDFMRIFRGTINFKRDLRPGDQFTVLYREYTVANHPFRLGQLVFASLQVGQKKYNALRFQPPNLPAKYYQLNGQGIKPLFILPPVKYKYISSHFTFHRLDPILHVYRPHLGIDYAANYGTPIRSIGDGHIVFAGKDEGYGNAIIIRYSHHYRALYGHLSHFAHGMHAGKIVKQGEIIGYVGSTGWSTGPHLHFSLYLHGEPKDPLKMHFGQQLHISKREDSAFQNYEGKILSIIVADKDKQDVG